MRDFEKIRHAFDEGKKTVSTAETDTIISKKARELQELNSELEKKKQGAIIVGQSIVEQARKEASDIIDRVSQVESEMSIAKNTLDTQLTKVQKELEKLKESQSKTAEKNRQLDNLRLEIEESKRKAEQSGIDIIAEAEKRADETLKQAKQIKDKNAKLQNELQVQVRESRDTTKRIKQAQKRIEDSEQTILSEQHNTIEIGKEQERLRVEIQGQLNQVTSTLERLSAIMLFVSGEVAPIIERICNGQVDVEKAVKQLEESRLLLLAEKQRLDAQKEFQEQRDIQLDEKSAIIKEQRVQLDTAIKEKNV